MPHVSVTRSPVRLLPDPTRRIVRPYLPAGHGPSGSAAERAERTVRRVLSLTEEEIDVALADVYERFAHRYPDFDAVLLRGLSAFERSAPTTRTLEGAERRLVGAYFLHEYAVEGAALTNPSIVAHPDHTNSSDGALGVVISLRAVGEGHLSSIEFRAGDVGPSGDIAVADPSPLVPGERRSPLFDKSVFNAKLGELGTDPALVGAVLADLDGRFTMDDLEEALDDLETARFADPAVQQVTHMVHWLASSNYEVVFDPNTDLSQRILSPNGPAESRGMEDARFVRFVDTDGSIVYYGTYTAFDGFNILPQLIETTDFRTFRVATLNGASAINKGIALFPRRIGDKFAALGRSDGESNYLMLSDHVRFWDRSEQIQVPARPWELLQIGNAGAPIETEAGWLVITHGVGPMRQYALGAILLDIDEPSRVIGHLREPFLVPNEDEREGYVPNVVYSCGAVLHGGNVIVAYGASDVSTSFATVPLDSLLSALTSR